MFKYERKIIEFIEKHLFVLFVSIISLIAVIIRIAGFDFIGTDQLGYYLPWYDEMVAGGRIHGLANQIGDYGIPYQIIIAIMTYIPINPLYQYKMVAMLFDFVLAFGVYGVLYKFTNDRIKSIIGYVLILFGPTVVINSAVWGQCDSIYTALLVLCFLFFLRENYNLCFIFLGLSFGFKLQALFILPFFVIHYLHSKKYSIIKFLYIPVVNIIMCIPALLMGRNWGDVFGVYLSQTTYFSNMTMNCPNLYAFTGMQYDAFFRWALLLTLAVLGIGLFAFWSKKQLLDNNRKWLALFIWVMWTCIMFLPGMHERYTYPIDILLLVLAFIYSKYWFMPVLATLISLSTYCSFIFGWTPVDFRYLATIYLILYSYFSYLLFTGKIERSEA